MTKFRMNNNQVEMLMDGAWLTIVAHDRFQDIVDEAILGPLMRGATCVTITVEDEDRAQRLDKG